MERIDSDIWSAAEVARLLTLVENEKRFYQEILSLCPVPMAVAGESLTLQSVNRAFRTLFNLKHGETAGVKVTDLFPALVIQDRVERALRQQTPVWQSDITLWTGGTGRACRLSVAPIPNPYGDQPTDVLIVAELPELGQSPAAALLDSTGVMAWQMNVATGELVFANTAPGMPDSAAEWNARAYKEDQSRVDWVYEAALESGKEAEVDYRASWGGWLSDRITPVLTDGKVTALRVLTLRIQQRRERLETLVRAREDEAAVRLAQHIAHQFNNMWMIVTGYTEVLREHLEGAGTDARQAIEEIDRAATRGAQATQQLLQFSRPPAVHPTQVDLQELLTRLDWDADVRFLPGQMLVNVDPAPFRQALLSLAQEIRPYLPPPASACRWKPAGTWPSTTSPTAFRRATSPRLLSAPWRTSANRALPVGASLTSAKATATAASAWRRSSPNFARWALVSRWNAPARSAGTFSVSPFSGMSSRHGNRRLGKPAPPPPPRPTARTCSSWMAMRVSATSSPAFSAAKGTASAWRPTPTRLSRPRAPSTSSSAMSPCRALADPNWRYASSRRTPICASCSCPATAPRRFSTPPKGNPSSSSRSHSHSPPSANRSA